MDRCPKCNCILGTFEGVQHGCMEGDYSIIYGRMICPYCGKGCYSFRYDNSPGNDGLENGQCCNCGKMIE